LGTDRPGAAIPELPRKACLPMRAGATRSHPWLSSYVATMVSSARNAPSSTVVIAGSASTVEASTPRPTFAPSSRSHTGVKRLA
jgi:hypothetical protein